MGKSTASKHGGDFDIHVARVIDIFNDFIDNLVKELKESGGLSIKNAKVITKVTKGLEQTRDLCIVSALQSGVSGKKLAEIYDLSPGRVSQIKSAFDKKKAEENSIKKSDYSTPKVVPTFTQSKQ